MSTWGQSWGACWGDTWGADDSAPLIQAGRSMADPRRERMLREDDELLALLAGVIASGMLD